MKRLLLAATALLTLSTVSNANIVTFLPDNPTSGSGAFANTNPENPGTPGFGSFQDVYTFRLSGGPQFVTIASVTNVFASLSQFIAVFRGSVWLDNAFHDGLTTGGDTLVIPTTGTVPATPCVDFPTICQGFAGSATLLPGNYYLLIEGTAALDAGYGGNLSTAAVPGPIVGAGLPGLLAVFGLGGLVWRRRKAASQQAS